MEKSQVNDDCIVKIHDNEIDTIDLLENSEICETKEVFENEENGTKEDEEEEEQPRKKLRIILIVLGSIVGFIGLMYLVGYMFQKSFIYYPNRSFVEVPSDNMIFVANNTQSDDVRGRLHWRVVEIMTKDGQKLHNYWFEADKDEKDPVTVLYLHGSAANIGFYLHVPYFFRNANVFLLDYRGYGKSSGYPSEIGLKSDAQAALDWIYQHLNESQKKKIIVFGHSLGGAVAIHLVSENNDKVEGLIVENSFLSVPRLLSGWTMLLRPFTCVIDQVYDSATAIKKVKSRILFLSGGKDTLIPPFHLKELNNLATSAKSKDFITFPNGNHNRLRNEPNYFSYLKSFLKGTHPIPIF